MADRKELQDVFISVCRASGFKLPMLNAAYLAADMLKCSPLEFWIALDYDNMERIAAGTHPAVQ